MFFLGIFSPLHYSFLHYCFFFRLIYLASIVRLNTCLLISINKNDFFIGGNCIKITRVTIIFHHVKISSLVFIYSIESILLTVNFVWLFDPNVFKLKSANFIRWVFLFKINIQVPLFENSEFNRLNWYWQLWHELNVII